MELRDSFEVDHPIAAVWAVLTDVERIAPCLPGAQLTGTDGDEFHGLVKVKVGPVTSQYKGKASFAELDESAHRAVISAAGRDTRGAGNASAEITVHLEPGDGAATKVSVATDLTVTGKVAQFGRGVLADVSRKLMGQFAGNLAELLAQQADEPTSDDAGASAAASVDATTSEAAAADDVTTSAVAASGDVTTSEAAGPSGDGAEASEEAPAAAGPVSPSSDAPQEVEAVDLLAVAGGSVMKRLVPVLAAVVVVVVVVVVVLSG